MNDLMTMFATFVAFVSGTIVITEAVNNLFKIKNSTAKLIISWVMPIILAVVGFVFQLGFFADCGTINEWQGWIKTVLIGFGCGLCANNIYDREEIWTLLKVFFPTIKKEKDFIE